MTGKSNNVSAGVCHQYVLVIFACLTWQAFVCSAQADETLLSSSPAGNEAWVAVGYGGRRMISTDGKTWEITAEWAQPGKDDSNNLMGLVFAKDRFVAVGGGGGGKTAGGHVLVSEDGRKWREVWQAPGRINPIAFGDDRFLVGGPRKQLYWSGDGETWMKGAKLEDKRCTHFRHAAYGNGVFVLTGNHGGNSEAWMFATKDGESISKVTFDIPNIRDVEFANGKFVVVGTSVRIVSFDGVKWESTDLPDGERLSWVNWLGDKFVTGGDKQIYTSIDGKHWDVDARRFRGTPKWTDGNRMISTGWPGKMFFSDDDGQTHGKRTLSHCQAKDLRQAGRVPACHASPHGDAFFIFWLFE